MRTTLCTVASVPTACRSAGLGDSSRGSSCAVTTIARSSPRDSINWMELSRPTVNGSTAWGNRTVSRTGRTGILRTPEESFPDGFLGAGGMEGWFCIECPRINFPSLDSADFEKFQESLLPRELPSLAQTTPEVDAVAVCSAFLRGTFADRSPSLAAKTRIIFNGVNTQLFYPREEIRE